VILEHRRWLPPVTGGPLRRSWCGPAWPAWSAPWCWCWSVTRWGAARWVGLILGALNARIAQVSVARYSDHGEVQQGQVCDQRARPARCDHPCIGTRLAVLSSRPASPVFACLAIFQLLTIVMPCAAGQEIRQS